MVSVLASVYGGRGPRFVSDVSPWRRGGVLIE